jgi:serine/threonine protein kinase
MENGSLASVLDKFGPLPETLIISYLHQVCPSLSPSSLPLFTILSIATTWTSIPTRSRRITSRYLNNFREEMSKTVKRSKLTMADIKAANILINKDGDIKVAGMDNIMQK